MAGHGGRREGAGAKRERGATVITIRTHDKTKSAIKARAAAAGVSLSEFMIRISIGEKGFGQFPDGAPCRHPGCASHISHPCEGCGRIGARS